MKYNIFVSIFFENVFSKDIKINCHLISSHLGQFIPHSHFLIKKIIFTNLVRMMN